MDTFANRLQKAINKNNIKPSELASKTGLDKSLISNYLSGNYKAKQDKLTILSKALNVNEVWLMGYDVPDDMDYSGCVHDDENNRFIFMFKDDENNIDAEQSKNYVPDELDILFSKNKDILTNEDKEYIKFIIEKRRKQIEDQINNK